MSEDSDWWEYLRRKMTEKKIQELREEVAELERAVEILDDSEEPTEAQEYEEQE